jgi:hypothetical protein
MSALHVASIGRLSGGDTAPRISHQRSLSGNVLNPRHPCSTACSRSCVVRASRRRGSTSGGQRVRPAGRTPDGNKGGRSLGLVEIEPDGSDLWRLDAVAECLRTGGVSILFVHVHVHTYVYIMLPNIEPCPNATDSIKNSISAVCS